MSPRPIGVLPRCACGTPTVLHVMGRGHVCVRCYRRFMAGTTNGRTDGH